MKKIIFTFGIAALLFSCSVENEEVVPSENNLTASIPQGDEVASYKGVFTTLNSKYRAIVSIGNLNVPTPTATISLVGGRVIELKASPTKAESQGSQQLLFTSSEASFLFTKGNNSASAEITQAIFKGMEASILVMENSLLVPATPVLGTWNCVVCNSHPVVNTGKLQSFNMIVPAGAGAITTQMILGSTAYAGIGDQNTCGTVGPNEVCTNDSGDGVSNIGFTVNGNPVTWTGTHTYPSGPTAESNVAGTWSWDSVSYGTLTGTYSGTSNLNVIYSENFTGFNGNGFAPMPAAGQLDSDIIIANGFNQGGPLAYGGTETTGDYARGPSPVSVSTGGIYAFDIGGGNPALGVQPINSDFTPGDFDFRIQNTTGATLSNFIVSYNIYSRNDQERSNSMNFSYSTDGTNYTAISALDFTSPAASTGNTWDMAARTGNFSANVSDNAYIYLRFSGDDVSGSNNRDEFAIDDIVLRAN